MVRLGRESRSRRMRSQTRSGAGPGAGRAPFNRSIASSIASLGTGGLLNLPGIREAKIALADLLAGAGDARHDRPGRDAQDLGNLLVGEVFDVLQDQAGAEFWLNVPEEEFDRSLLALSGRLRLQEPEEASPAPPGKPVESVVHGHAMDPGPELRITPEAREVFPDDQEDVVKRILGLLGIREEAGRQPVDRVLEVKVASLEGGRIAPAQSLDDVCGKRPRAAHELVWHPVFGNQGRRILPGF